MPGYPRLSPAHDNDVPRYELEVCGREYHVTTTIIMCWAEQVNGKGFDALALYRDAQKGEEQENSEKQAKATNTYALE